MVITLHLCVAFGSYLNLLVNYLFQPKPKSKKLGSRTKAGAKRKLREYHSLILKYTLNPL